jgi:carbamoyl-phosphate synthase large subunit
MMKRILVTGAAGPASVNFIKSLRASDEEFYIVGVDMNKYRLELPDVDKRYLVPSHKDPAYIDIINKITEKENIDLVHPQPDTEVKFISDNRDKFKAKVFLPKKHVVDVCQDKLESALVWKKHGVPVPESMLINNDEDLKEAADKYGFPFWVRATLGAGGRGSTLVEKIEVGIAWLKYWKERGMKWQFFAQEYLPGRNIAFQSVWNKGEVVCSQARERLEYIYPYLAPSGITGTPAVARTISDDKVNEVATKCVRALDPEATGIFCVDLKGNDDDVPCPTEINTGRFFTTSNFFTTAGINMPYIYVKLAFGEEVPKLEKNYNIVDEGVYWIRHMDSGPKLMKEGEWTSEKAF